MNFLSPISFQSPMRAGYPVSGASLEPEPEP
jgi:hypothetical protein